MIEKKQWVKPALKRFDLQSLAAMIAPAEVEPVSLAAAVEIPVVEKQPLDTVAMLRADFLHQEREQERQQRCA